MRSRIAMRAAIATILLLGPASLVSAEPFSTIPQADAFLYAGEANSNYGGGGVITVAAPNLPQGGFQSLLRFDLAGAKSSFDTTFGPGNWLLSSATLQLSAASPNNSIFNTSAAGQISATWLQNDNWDEGAGSPTSPGTTGVTWNSLSSLASANDQSLGLIDFDGSTNATATYSLNVSPGLAADAAAGGLTSILLSPATGDMTVAAAFNSRSFSTTARRPLLTVNAVAIPEPAGAMLFGVGALGLALVGRRKLARRLR
jgi:hypothetical protein